MCGLFAGVGKLNSGCMIALGSMNEERGIDSVGIAYVQNSKIEIAKVAERPCVALNTTLRKQVTEAAVSGMFIGHTRAATQGKVTSRNAHPFFSDDIAFAHNGIIMNDDEFGKYEVDSESLIHGIKDKDFSRYEGPIALLWIQNGKLNAYRCGNPLYRGRHNGTLYLASNDEYLKEVGCTQVKELSEGMIYTFHNPQNIVTEKVKKNKLWGLSKTINQYTSCLGLGSDYTTKKEHTSLMLTERQALWWQEEYKLDNSELVDKEKSLLVKEDFRTNSDISKENLKACCECCGRYAELVNEMCLACIEWMKDNGVNENDLPPMSGLQSVK